MLYKRSSFLSLLQKKYTCDLKPLSHAPHTILVKNGPAHTYIFVDQNDRIDYEEIYLHYKKLCLESLPSPSELESAEDVIRPSSKKKNRKK